MADLSASGREQAAKSGMAMQGGRFPIKTMADMHNAIHAVGRAQGGEAGRCAVRRFIMKRAKALGGMDQIPASWNADGSLK